MMVCYQGVILTFWKFVEFMMTISYFEIVQQKQTCVEGEKLW
jgi:hypothetical protein